MAVLAIFLGIKIFSSGEVALGTGTMKKENIFNIMLLGVDSRSEDAGRSDTLMVVTIDTESERAALLSVPRDTRVKIDGYGYDKINHAYAYGGHKLTQKSVENLLGVKIDRYVLIDTGAFERIVDAVGGVDIDVEKRMYYEDPWDDNGGLVIDLYPGEQHLDGYRAIQYVRYRDGEGDIGRIGRQQKFMRALVEQAISPAIISRLPQIIERVSRAAETDMSVSELVDFAKKLKELRENGLAAKMVPGRPAYYEDISYWLPDIAALRADMAAEIGVEMTDSMKKDAELAAAEYEKALPKDLKIADASVESPAAKEKADKTDAGDDAKKKEADDELDEVEKESPKPSDISVMVINSSGINGAGAEVAGILERKGFIISGVETGKTDSRENTTITTAGRNTDIFYGMPFDCLILDGGDENQAVVNIGKDYAADKRE